MSHVPPASTLTNISSKQCIYVCFLQHRLVPYTILTGFRLLRSLWELLWATILYMYWRKRNSRIKCQLHCTRRITCVPARVPNAIATRHVQDFHYTTRRKHWPSPSPLAFTSTFAASPFENPTFIRHNKSQDVQTANEDQKTWTKLRQALWTQTVIYTTFKDPDRTAQ